MLGWDWIWGRILGGVFWVDSDHSLNGGSVEGVGWIYIYLDVWVTALQSSRPRL